VITADAGGMGEYVRHEVNGLLYEHRDFADLSRQMQRLVQDPALAQSLGERGYLFSDDGEIPDIHAHAIDLEQQYKRVMN